MALQTIQFTKTQRRLLREIAVRHQIELAGALTEIYAEIGIGEILERADRGEAGFRIEPLPSLSGVTVITPDAPKSEESKTEEKV